MAVNSLLHDLLQLFYTLDFDETYLEGVGRLTEEGRVGGRALSLSRFCCRLLCGALLLGLETSLHNCCWFIKTSENPHKFNYCNIIYSTFRTDGSQKVIFPSSCCR